MLTFTEIMQNLSPFAKGVTAVIEFVANTVTALLGIAALWGLTFHRKKLNEFVRLIASSAINDRIKQIKGTLGKLESLNYDIKEQRREILAVMGELLGMLRSFYDSQSRFKQVYDELMGITENNQRISEPIKRRLCAEIHSLLDDHSVTQTLTIAENDHG